MANPITHIEIPVADLGRAKGFYESAFGWSVKELEWMQGYALFQAGEGVGGALWQAPEQAGKDGIRIYVDVDDIPPAIDRVTAAGGTVVEGKTLIHETVGYYALVTDTEDNRLGLFSKT